MEPEKQKATLSQNERPVTWKKEAFYFTEEENQTLVKFDREWDLFIHLFKDSGVLEHHLVEYFIKFAQSCFTCCWVEEKKTSLAYGGMFKWTPDHNADGNLPVFYWDIDRSDPPEENRKYMEIMEQFIRYYEEEIGRKSSIYRDTNFPPPQFKDAAAQVYIVRAEGAVEETDFEKDGETVTAKVTHNLYEWHVQYDGVDGLPLPSIGDTPVNVENFFPPLPYEFVSSNSEEKAELHLPDWKEKFVELAQVNCCIYKYLSDEENGWEEGDVRVFLTQKPYSVAALSDTAASPPAPPESQTEEPEAE